ncbi:MAG: tetratricopeptide repeat protein [Bacteroidales bacterium]
MHYFEKTISLLEERDVFDTITFYRAALAAFNCQKFDKAIRYYNRCIQHKYKLADCYLDISDAYRGINDLYDAEKWLKEAEKILPKEKNKRLSIQLANLYLAKKQFDTALIYIEIAITIKPVSAELYYTRGSIYERMGYRNQAIESYKQVLNIDSAYYDANYNLAALYFNHAVELYNELKNTPKSQPKIEDEMVLMIKNEFLNALPYIENSYRIKQDDAAVIKNLKILYEKLNITDKEIALNKGVLMKILGKSIVKPE